MRKTSKAIRAGLDFHINELLLQEFNLVIETNDTTLLYNDVTAIITQVCERQFEIINHCTNLKHDLSNMQLNVVIDLFKLA